MLDNVISCSYRLSSTGNWANNTTFKGEGSRRLDMPVKKAKKAATKKCATKKKK
jgi:hypothetical protein